MTSKATKSPPQGRNDHLLRKFFQAQTSKGSRLGSPALGILLVLDGLGMQGEYPGTAAMAELLGLNRGVAYRAVESLEFAKLLRIFDVKAGQPPHYSLTPELTADVPSTSVPVAPATTMEVAAVAATPVASSTGVVLSSAPAMETPVLVPQAAPAAPVDRVAPPVVDTAPQAAQPAPAAPKGKRTKVSMTDAQKAWFLASSQNIDLHIRYGVEAYGKTRTECNGYLKSSPMDWLADVHDTPKDWSEAFPFQDWWTVNHFMGFYWHLVCKYRPGMGIPLSLPDWGRIGKIVRTQLDTTTGETLCQRMILCCQQFPLICWNIGRIGEGLSLDETSLGHSLVSQNVTRILTEHLKDPTWIHGEYARMAADKAKAQERQLQDVNY